MNIPFSFKNRYFPKKFTESASTGGDPNVRCSSVETQTYWYCGILCIFYDLSIYLSIYLPTYLSMYLLSISLIHLSISILYMLYILYITYYIYIYIYIYIWTRNQCVYVLHNNSKTKNTTFVRRIFVFF